MPADHLSELEKLAWRMIRVVLAQLEPQERANVFEQIFDVYCRHCGSPSCRGVCANDD